MTTVGGPSRPLTLLSESVSSLPEAENALHHVADAGAFAARWVRTLAERQSEDQHRTVLIGFAAAVELALTWMVADPSLSAERSGVPAQWELDHHLDADVLIGAVCLDSLPSLTSVEQVALVAVGAIARTAPAAWRSDYRQLIPLGEAIHAAVALARPGR